MRNGNALSLYGVTFLCRAVACCAEMLGLAEGRSAAVAGSAAAAAARRSAAAQPQCSQHADEAGANGLCMENRTVGVDGSSAFAAGDATPFPELAAAGSEIGAGLLELVASAVVDITGKQATKNSSRLVLPARTERGRRRLIWSLRLMKNDEDDGVVV